MKKMVISLALLLSFSLSAKMMIPQIDDEAKINWNAAYENVVSVQNDEEVRNAFAQWRAASRDLIRIAFKKYAERASQEEKQVLGPIIILVRDLLSQDALINAGTIKSLSKEELMELGAKVMMLSQLMQLVSQDFIEQHGETLANTYLLKRITKKGNKKSVKYDINIEKLAPFYLPFISDAKAVLAIAQQELLGKEAEESQEENA